MKNIGRIVFTAFLILSILFPAGQAGNFSLVPSPVLAGEDDETEIGSPHLFIAWNTSVQEFHAGEEKNLIIPIFNDGNGTASQCYASLSVSNPNEFPFVLDGLKTTRPLTNIKSKQTIWADFGKVKVSSSAKSQLYEVTVNVEYKDEMGMLNRESSAILIRIINDDYTPKLNFTGVQLKTEGRTVKAGTETEIKLCMKNDGSEAAEDVALTLSGFTQDGISLNQSMDVWKADTVAGGEKFYVPYQIKLHKDMLTGTYPLDLSLKYKDSSDHEITDSIKVYLQVDGKESSTEDKATPRLIISNYDFGSSYIKAGDTFTLKMIFFNTSLERDIQNVKVSVSSDDNAMSPVGSSNTFVIQDIKKGSSLEKTIILQPVIDADTKIYNVNVSMDYQDDEGTALTAQEVIGIPVVQEIRFTLSEMEIPQEAYIDMPAEVSVDYYNMGRAELRNLMISTEGNFEIREGESYIGNVESGKSDYFSVTLIPHETGKQEGRIHFNFEDAIGNKYHQEKTFTIDVEENPNDMMPEMDDLENMGGMEEIEPPSRHTGWYIGGGAALAAVILGMILHRRHVRKQQEEIEIDE